jgi:CubicO group peptidase (beta-lactamase class C family)
MLAVILAKTLLAQNSITEKLDGLITAYTAVDMFNGSALVEKDGKVLLNKGYGYTNISRKIKNTVDSKYQIYSITKSELRLLTNCGQHCILCRAVLK